MTEDKFTKLFREIIREKHDMDVDFKTIESNLKHLRDGAELKYGDLEMIADKKYWPFQQYWMWPCREQIESKLKMTAGSFLKLPEEEEAIIKKLYIIFKNISLVSIILRFAWPEYYAIYSRPPLKILRIERGSSDTEEYMNYIRDLRILKRSFGLFRTAEMDMLIWVVAQKKDKYLKNFKSLIAKHMPERLSPEDLVSYLTTDPLKIAYTFSKHKDYATSALWAAKAFELFIRNEARKLINRVGSWEDMSLFDLVNELIKKPKYQDFKVNLHKLRKLRNTAVHSQTEFDMAKLKFFIGNVDYCIKNAE